MCAGPRTSEGAKTAGWAAGREGGEEQEEEEEEESRRSRQGLRGASQALSNRKLWEMCGTLRHLPVARGPNGPKNVRTGTKNQWQFAEGCRYNATSLKALSR